ncbi:MAG: chemotaxis protein CheB [Nitrospirales bacterium]|nr:response regulator [Nitrospirales bacterium]
MKRPPAKRPLAAKAKTGKKPQKSSRTPPHASSPRDPSVGDSEISDHSMTGPFPIVGIGASAGGFEAFTKLFALLPPDSGIGFVLMQHLAPDYDSLLAELLSKYTAMPIHAIMDHMPVQPNHIYTLRHHALLTIEGGIFRLAEASSSQGRVMLIDHFFRSLGQDQGPHAIGIILSGTGSDGTAGIRAIKEQGGMSIAQSIETSKFDGMPRSAVLSGLVDHIVAVDRMPKVLTEYAGHLSGLQQGKGWQNLDEDTDRHVNAICAHLLSHTGHDFRQYKRSTLCRRIRRRMQVLHLYSAAVYADRVKHSPEEAKHLFQDLLIGVTQFFRDPKGFEALSRDVIPQIAASKRPGEVIRVWVPGCSTGEEAYSIAMVLYEHVKQKNLGLSIQIFATDLDEEALEIARSGRYAEPITDQVKTDRLSRFFQREGNVYRVISSIRDVCTFSLHNVISDPPFSHMDLISCRNLLIYMDAALHAQVFSAFHFSLNRNGFLFLGPSEHAAENSPYFRSIHKPHRIFQVKEAVNPVSGKVPVRVGTGKTSIQKAGTLHFSQGQEKITQQFDWLVRQDYGPPAVLIDRDGTIQHISGQTRTYLQLPPGKPNINLLNMVRPDLRVILRTAIFQAIKNGKEIIQKQVRQGNEEGAHLLDVIVRPLFPSTEKSEWFMVVFREYGLSSPNPRASKKRDKGFKEENRLIRDLEQDLKTTQAQLQSTVEELETSNQELKSSNEELLSVNEELQASNEELQTSKEELQSMNEELGTVNTQLVGKVEELDQAYNDMENLFRTTEIATLFLNADLCIQKYTPAAQQLFQFLEIDVGRPINQLSSFSRDDTLKTDIEDVLRTAQPNEKIRQFPQDPRIYLSRMSPYCGSERQMLGVVMTFVDITHVRKMENHVFRFSQQQTAVAGFGQFALQERDLIKVMNECVRLLKDILMIDLVKILELMPDKQSLLLRAGIGWKDGLVGQAMVGTGLESQAGYTLQTNESVIVENFAEETRFSDSWLLRDHQVVSGLSCIIRDQAGQHHGVLSVHTRSKKEFSEDDVRFLQTMANILASAIHRKKIESQLESVKESLEGRVLERTRKLTQHEQRLRQLSSELVMAEQRERRRLATELHDYLCQMLVVGKIKTSQLLQSGLTHTHTQIVTEIEDSLADALQFTRDLITQVSPPILYEFGLLKAIPWLAQKMARYNLDVTVTSHLDHASPHIPEAIAEILFHGLRELLFNVMKHAGTSKACIDISQDSPASITFQVTDEGCGFDLSALSDDSSRLQKFGLLNIQERIHGVGGECDIQSSIGAGTRVRMRIPLSVESPASRPTSSSRPIIHFDDKEKLEGVIRVVIADDHPIFREGLRTLLGPCSDIQVVGEAENGEQAISLVQTLAPDVVVMDINMPGVNGIEATRAIKATHAFVHVIGLSMHGDQLVKDAFFEAGGDQYVTKEDSFQTFAEIVRASRQR